MYMFLDARASQEVTLESNNQGLKRVIQNNTKGGW